MQKVLEIINHEMALLGINYFYLTNDSPQIVYPYVTGEYSESEYTYEDGANSGEMLLECWTRGSNLDLVELNEKIKDHFRNFKAYDNKFACYIAYNSNYPRRTNDNSLKKLEIHLSVVYWEGV